MNPNIFKLGGHAINDGSNYEAWFVGDIFFRQAQGKVNLSKRADHVPAFTSKERQGKTFKIVIISRSSTTDFSDAYTELNKWFDTFEEEELTLIVKDSNDSNRQWYLNVAVEDTPKVMPDGFYLDLVAADPIWRTVTVNTPATWAVTASGQTHDFTILGNRPVDPIIELTPTDTKVGGYANRMARVWYNPKTSPEYVYDDIPWDITNAAWDTRELVADSSVSNRINQGGGITAVATSIPVDTSVGGGLDATGGVCYVDSEQIKYDSISGGVMTVSSGGRGWGGTTAATHADNAVMKKSHMLANGADVQLYDGTRRMSRWVRGVNTAATKVWGNVDFLPGLEMELAESIASSGAVATVKIRPTPAGIAALGEITKRGATFMFMIGSEIFSGTGSSPMELNITGTTRAILTSAMAAHAVGDIIRWVQHPFWVCWGDLNVSGTSEDALTQDDTNMPMIDMDQSTNASWYYSEFYDSDELRSAAFKRTISGRNCAIMGGTQATHDDPATVLGMLGRVYELNGAPQGNSYKLTATLFHPAGFNAITCNGKKYKYTAGYATNAGLYSSNSLTIGMVRRFNEAHPTVAQSWQAWSQTAVALNGNRFIEFRLEGNIAGVANNMHALEVQTISALTITTNRLQLGFSGAPDDVYEFGRDNTQTPMRITNNENGEYIHVLFQGEIGETLRIDCNAEKITYLKDNTRADYAVTYPPRDHIFQFIPGTDGVNTITITDAGMAGVNAVFKWEDRNS